MSSKLCCSLLLIGTILTAGSTFAQQYVRPEGTGFIKPKVGLSTYLGDNEKSPKNFNGDAFETAFPWGIGVEIGYQTSVQNSYSFAYYVGDYPVITQFPPPPLREGDALADDPSTRSSLQLFYRRTFGSAESKIAPFVNLGLTYSFGTVTQDNPPNFSTEESAGAFGPLVGAGLDFTLNPQTSFFLEWNIGIHFGDDQLDGNADNGLGSTDLLTGIGLGLKYNFKKALTPVFVLGTTCPGEPLLTNEAGAFSAMINEHATAPVETAWDFGDGNSGTGLETSHTYTESGTFTVTFTGSNEVSSTSGSCMVTVIAPAEIVTVTVDKPTVSICDENPEVTFSANTRGDAPISYMWDFGDGNTSTEANPSHTYGDMGTYSVTLEVTNAGGSDTNSAVSVTVNNEGCFNCDISEMNSNFFDRNSSVLTPEARDQLQENLEILQNCEFDGRVEGHASRDERNTQQLSEDRARVTMQFYIDNGIDVSRLTSMGMGASGQTTKKSGASQFRRADTIPVKE